MGIIGGKYTNYHSSVYAKLFVVCRKKLDLAQEGLSMRVTGKNYRLVM